MDITNKHILEIWSNDGYIQKWLRFLNRKGAKYFFADTQSDYFCNRDGKESYRFHKKTAHRYFVKNGAIVRGLNNRSNTDGEMTFDVVEDIEMLLSPHTYKDLFETNLFNVLPFGSPKLRHIDRIKKRHTKRGTDMLPEEYTYCYDIYDENRKEPFFKYLRAFFKREKIFTLCDYYYETNKNMSIIETSMIRMHVNHFGGYKKDIGFENNRENHTIGFWLFEDCIVYTDQSGMGTW